MSAELSFFLSTGVALFVIVDPFALVPVYLQIGERFTDDDRLVIRRKATVVAFGILMTFALSGMAVFKVFGITMPAFQIAGGILLLIFGVGQLTTTRKRVTRSEKEESDARDDISIFPLATPLIAGPGAISTVVLYSTKSEGLLRMGNLCAAISTVLFLTYITLKFAPLVYRVLGKTGLNLLTRLMGIIVSAVAVQFIINGIKGAFGLT